MPRKQNTSAKHYNDPFPTKLRKLMWEKKITQDELKDVLGVATRQSVTGYIDGSTAPSAEKIASVARYFHVSADYLLGLSDVPSATPEMKAAAAFTGLSEKAVSLLSSINDYSFDLVSALSFLLEDVGFYRSVLTSVSLFIKHRQLAAGAVKEFDDFMEIAADEELDLLERLTKDYGIEYSGPAEAMRIDANNAGNGLSRMLSDIASDLIIPSEAASRYRQIINDDWLAVLKKVKTEEE